MAKKSVTTTIYLNSDPDIVYDAIVDNGFLEEYGIDEETLSEFLENEFDTVDIAAHLVDQYNKDAKSLKLEPRTINGVSVPHKVQVKHGIDGLLYTYDDDNLPFDPADTDFSGLIGYNGLFDEVIQQFGTNLAEDFIEEIMDKIKNR